MDETGRVDVLEGLRVFCAVADERSFTRGSQRCRLSQPVASRRVAALEEHLGVELLRRTSRRVDLTPTGERVLPLAHEIVDRADRLAVLVRSERPGLRVAVPEALDPRARAAIRRGLPDAGVEFVEAEPAVRAARLATGSVSLALLPVAPDRAEVVVPLGLAHLDDVGGRRVLLGTLRRPVRQRDEPARAVHLSEEDDVPTVRDLVRAACHGAGLRADQLVVGLAGSERWTRVHEVGDVVLASSAEAEAQGLPWTRVAQPDLARGYRLEGVVELDADARERLLARLAAGLSGAVRHPEAERG